MGSAKKLSKKNEVAGLLKEAGQLLKKAGDKLIKAAEAQQKLEQASDKLARAAQASLPSKYEPIPELKYRGKTQRDGLPVPIRRAILREGMHVGSLLERVKAVPLNQGEKAIQKVKKMKGNNARRMAQSEHP